MAFEAAPFRESKGLSESQAVRKIPDGNTHLSSS